MNSTWLQMLNSSNGSYHSRVPRHSSFILPNTWVHCYHPTELNTDIQDDCLYVRNNSGCNEYVRIVNYLDFFVCNIGASNSFSGMMQIMACSFILLSVYFLALMIIARHFVLPNIIAITKVFHMMDFEFGLTIVTLLLQAPDIIEDLVNCNTFPALSTLLITEDLGKVLCCLSIGLIVLSFSKRFHRFKVSYFIQFTISLTFGVSYVVWILSYKQIQEEKNDEEEKTTVNLKLQGAGLALVYVTALLFVVILSNKNATLEEPQEQEQYSFDKQHRLYREDRQMLMYIYTFNPFANIKDWKFPAVLAVSPLWLLAALQIPVVDLRRPMNGWCKFSACTSLIIYPILFWFYHNLVPIVLYITLPLGILELILTYVLTEVDEKPKYHEVFAFYGIIVGSTWFYIIDNEIENLLWQLGNYLWNWSLDTIVLLVYPASLGLIVYTICFTLAKMGKEDMALGIVVGICIKNAFLTLPIGAFRLCQTDYIKVVITSNTFTGFVFIILILIYTFVYVLLVNFELRRSFGIAILLQYGLFIVVMILSEFEQIHPYGTTHSVLRTKYISVIWS